MNKHTVAQVEDMIATEDDAVVSEMLRAYVTLLTEKADNGITHWNGTTHYAGCIQSGKAHYECALQEIGRLRLTITDLRVKLETAGKEIEVQKAKAEKHYELGTEYFDLMVKAEREIATLRDALSRLVEVHDAMGGVCGTVRIAAEEALLGKAQSEYICTCGIRVTPHKCPTDNGF